MRGMRTSHAEREVREDMAHRILCLSLLILVILAGCSTPESTKPVTVAEPVVSETEAHDATTTEAPPVEEPRTISTQEAMSLLLPALGASAIGHYAHQPIVMSPSHEAVLYLMRAARYREAADFATRTDGSTSMRFVHAKARILAGLCTPDAPCADEIAALKATGQDLPAIFEYWRIRGLTADGRFADAITAIEAWFTRYADISPARELLLSFCDAVKRAGGFDQESDTPILLEPSYRKITKLSAKLAKGANAFEAASLTYYEMRIAQLLDEPNTAAQKKTALVLRYPATQMSVWPELASSPEDLAARFTPAERYARIERLVAHFDYDSARRELKALVEDEKTPDAIRDKAELELARVSMTNSEEPGLSESIYRKWAKKKGKMQEEAVFGISRALSRQLRYEDAIEALKVYDQQYPKGKYSMRSLYLRGWYLFDLRRNEEARPLLKAYAEKTNDTAVWGFYAQSFIRDGMWAEAITAFENLKRNNNPIVRGKALYWQAYAEYQRGNVETAKTRLSEVHKEFPLTWYDMLAYEREQDWFGADEEAAFLAALRWEEDPRQDNTFYAWGWGSPVSAYPTAAVWKRIESLAEHDAIREARALYQQNEQAILNSVPAASRDAFRLYATHLVESYNAAWEDCSGSVRALSDVWPERNNPRHKMAYPQPFGPLVESLAMDYGLPHPFIYGIMLQESRFRPWQVSTADAIGALQMIPRTARPIAKILGVEFHPETFFDPRVGFPYSAYYMKSHYERWGHNLTFTAGSYNGGPHRIGPWALRDKGKTIDFIVDEFSFDESRHYARKVADHTLRFAYLYARSPQEWMDIVHEIVPRVVPEIEAVDDWGL